MAIKSYVQKIQMSNKKVLNYTFTVKQLVPGQGKVCHNNLCMGQ